jgi:hypothetical protein
MNIDEHGNEITIHTIGTPMPGNDWYGSESAGYCRAWSPTRRSQCLGQPDHEGAHVSIAEDWDGPGLVTSKDACDAIEVIDASIRDLHAERERLSRIATAYNRMLDEMYRAPGRSRQSQ